MPQTEPMAIGSAFDSFVKAEIARLLGKTNRLAELLERSVEPQNFHLVKEANKLFELYNYCGRVKNLIDEGIEDIELEFREDIGGVIVPGTKALIGGVTLFGKPDALLKGNIPLDWKVNGWNSKTGQSPKKGYKDSIIIKNNQIKEQNKRHSDYPLNLEQIDQDWATQLLFYWWLLDKCNSLPPMAAIEQVAIRQDTIALVSYRATIGQEFANNIWTQLIDIWERFLDGKFKEPEPGLYKCEPFNNPRTCTLECSAYKETLGDPMKREMIVAQKLR
jgi:hypothetical protein